MQLLSLKGFFEAPSVTFKAPTGNEHWHSNHSTVAVLLDISKIRCIDILNNTNKKKTTERKGHYPSKYASFHNLGWVIYIIQSEPWPYVLTHKKALKKHSPSLSSLSTCTIHILFVSSSPENNQAFQHKRLTTMLCK